MKFDLNAIEARGLIGDGPITEGLRAFPDAMGNVVRAGTSPVHRPADLDNVEHPQRVRDLLDAYVDAGATLIGTNTLNSNRLVLERFGLADRVRELNRAGASICRQAADAGRGCLVAGQIGPSGRFLSLGETTAGELTDAYSAQSIELAAGGSDVILCARFSDLDELLLAVGAVAGETRLPIIAALVFDSGPERLSTATDVTAAQAAAALASSGAVMIGADCAAPETALTLVHTLRREARRPVYVRTNAGTPEYRDNRIFYSESPAAFAARAVELRRAGAAIIAGCCGATPAHVRALAGVWGPSTGGGAG